MLDILFTVDTELQFRSPFYPGWSVDANYDANILGKVEDGHYGLPFLLETFARNELKAVFFVEALSARFVGEERLARTVEQIVRAEQEVQLHLHPEWLWEEGDHGLGVPRGEFLRDYSLDEQAALIAVGRDELMRAGAPAPSAFRAGCFGANDDTLAAVRRNGIRFDSSYDALYRGGPCEITLSGDLSSPRRLHGVVEVPVTVFECAPGRQRHAQLTACSFSELRAMLYQAHGLGWPLFVILTHSFELVSRNRCRVNRVVLRRFEELCRFIAHRRDLFRTVGFGDLRDRSFAEEAPEHAALKSNAVRTVARYFEQAAGRWYER